MNWKLPPVRNGYHYTCWNTDLGTSFLSCFWLRVKSHTANQISRALLDQSAGFCWRLLQVKLKRSPFKGSNVKSGCLSILILDMQLTTGKTGWDAFICRHFFPVSFQGNPGWESDGLVRNAHHCTWTGFSSEFLPIQGWSTIWCLPVGL